MLYKLFEHKNIAIFECEKYVFPIRNGSYYITPLMFKFRVRSFPEPTEIRFI